MCDAGTVPTMCLFFFWFVRSYELIFYSPLPAIYYTNDMWKIYLAPQCQMNTLICVAYVGIDKGLNKIYWNHKACIKIFIQWVRLIAGIMIWFNSILCCQWSESHCTVSLEPIKILVHIWINNEISSRILFELFASYSSQLKIQFNFI